jgi:hypothetical protein
VQALTDLLNRALEKPGEHVQIAGHDFGPLVIRWQRDESNTLESGSNVIDIEAKQIEAQEPENE